ncbi:hypothetical protein TPAR_04505 [Tolypocladium paradoxum]|uniref:Uncharacterized protein n=1 Tax=Tolypocladium paradoxum TaxID=94208 RepID=A0A2S4KYR5_9HYPO|nr:hypothetical protein TPAR_04505 [Tolypocladium paradoxum]
MSDTARLLSHSSEDVTNGRDGWRQQAKNLVQFSLACLLPNLGRGQDTLSSLASTTRAPLCLNRLISAQHPRFATEPIPTCQHEGWQIECLQPYQHGPEKVVFQSTTRLQGRENVQT